MAHTDQLVWNLEGLGNRGTQTIRGIEGNAPYHWDGTQLDAPTLVNGGVTGGVFQGSITPCEVTTMSEYITNVVFPPSPHRGPADLMTQAARLGVTEPPPLAELVE